jgi:hypothetical protein
MRQKMLKFVSFAFKGDTSKNATDEQTPITILDWGFQLSESVDYQHFPKAEI